jgi:hypothetical protein
MLSEIAVKVQSGQKYKFAVHPLDARCRQVAGVYMVTHRAEAEEGQAVHHYLSIGETDDLSQWREQLPEIVCHESHNANCIGVLYEPDYQNRLRIVNDIRESFELPCD